MHLEILDKERITILHELSNLSFIRKFYLIGGTSLSLQMGLRKSIDFDFASAEHFDVDLLETLIKEKFEKKVKVVDKSLVKSTLNLFIDNVQVSFFEYKHKIINDLVSSDDFPNIYFASVQDILCMKAIAINQRGSKKDFYDFACITKEHNILPSQLIDLMLQKFNDFDVLKTLSFSLSFFEDAEYDELPETFYNFDWIGVKEYMNKYQKKYAKTLLITSN